MNEFLTLDIFGTFAGMIIFITVLTQALKYFIPLEINPKIYAIVLSAVANVANLVFINHTYTAESIFLMIVNIFIVAFAASGGYEYAVKPIERKLEIKNITKLEGKGE